MPLPDFWEMSFRNRYPDTRAVSDAYRHFAESCWPYEVQVHHVARHKLKRWLEQEGWMGRAGHELLSELGCDPMLRSRNGLGQGSGSNRVLMALLMFLAWVIATKPGPSAAEIAALSRQCERGEGA